MLRQRLTTGNGTEKEEEKNIMGEKENNGEEEMREEWTSIKMQIIALKESG